MRPAAPHRRSKNRPPAARARRDPDRDIDPDPIEETDPPPVKSRRGGARPGAGRPPGSVQYRASDFLCRAKSHRVPEDAVPEVVELADFALNVITDIAAGRVRSQIASVQLKAAIQLRLECCLPIVQELDVKGVSLVNALTSITAEIAAKDPGAFPSMRDENGHLLFSPASPAAPADPEELARLGREVGYPGPASSKGDRSAETDEVAVEEAPEEAPPPRPPPFQKLIPPYAPGSEVFTSRFDPPTGRGYFATPDNTDTPDED